MSPTCVGMGVGMAKIRGSDGHRNWPRGDGHSGARMAMPTIALAKKAYAFSRQSLSAPFIRAVTVSPHSAKELPSVFLLMEQC